MRHSNPPLISELFRVSKIDGLEMEETLKVLDLEKVVNAVSLWKMFANRGGISYPVSGQLSNSPHQWSLPLPHQLWLVWMTFLFIRFRLIRIRFIRRSQWALFLGFRKAGINAWTSTFLSWQCRIYWTLNNNCIITSGNEVHTNVAPCFFSCWGSLRSNNGWTDSLDCSVSMTKIQRPTRRSKNNKLWQPGKLLNNSALLPAQTCDETAICSNSKWIPVHPFCSVK